MKNAEKSIGKTSKGLGGFAKSVGKIATGIGVFKLVDKGISMITGSVDRAISRVDALNQFPKVLQQMGYGADEAAKATQTLLDGIDGLPTTLDGITGDVQRLVNVFQDVDKSADSAVALNNAFLASGASTDEASRGFDQYVKMLSTGKVNMQSWQTLQETMPYSLQETAEAFEFTGKTAQNDFYEALKDGDITMDEFNNKIIELSEKQGGFAEVAIEATKGINTSWGNIQTAIANGVAKSIQAFDDFLESKGLGGISGVLDNIKGAVSGAFGTVNAMIPVALEWFAKLYNKVAESTAWTTLTELVRATVDVVTDLWNKFMESEALENAGGLLQTIGEAILAIDFMKFAEDVGGFLETWSPLIAGVTAGILAFQLITGAITLWTTITTIATGVGGAFAAVMAFITSPIGIVVIAIGLLVAAGIALWKNWDTVKEKSIEIWNSVTEFFVNTFEKIKEVFNNALNWIDEKTNGKFKVMTDGIRNYMKMISDNLKAVWDYIKNTFKNALAFLKALVTLDFGGMKDAMKNQMDNAKNLVSNILTNIKNFFSNTFGGILSTTKEKFNAVKDAIMTPINKAVDLVKSAIDKIKGFFSGMSLKFPKLKMPKLPSFKLDGKFSLAPPSVPKLKVNWNAAGGIFDKPTIFNTNKGLQGVGEAGPEAILPLTRSVLGTIGDKIHKNMNRVGRDVATNNTTNNSNKFEINVTMNEVNDSKNFFKEINSELQSMGVKFI